MPLEQQAGPTSDSGARTLVEGARRRIAWRLLPFLFVLYVVAFLDRMNVGAAALQMPHDLGLSDRAIGLGAGIFFLGYFLLEIPGALIAERWSARRWIARIMISWGILTCLMAFIHSAREFYIVRFLVGAAEGTRSTVTIPAGVIGNELPIQSVSERWYSPELQTIVMTKRSDPRFGETVYRLTNIQRTEQPSSLFEVPADYTMRDDMTIINEKMNRARKLADEGK